MKNMKRIVALLMMVLLVVSLAACGSDKSDKKEEKKEEAPSIVGTWEVSAADYLMSMGYPAELTATVSGTVTMVFDKDGKSSVTIKVSTPEEGEQTQEQKMTYEIKDGKLYVLPEGETTTEGTEFKVDSKNLTITDSGITLTLTRK